MRVAELQVEPNWVLSIVADDGRVGRFDVSPYLQYEAFEALRDQADHTPPLSSTVRLQRAPGSSALDGEPRGRKNLLRGAQHVIFGA